MKPMCLILFGLLLTSAAPLAAQTTTVMPGPNGTMVVTTNTSGPARDAASPQTGTGRISGRVVDAETAAPLHDTMLRLIGGGLRESPAVGTDENGRFEFENLPPGRYTLSANKPGYMTLAYGQRRPFENGRPIELADKQTLTNVDFAVPRGGVIVVRMTDENGDPLSNVRVLPQRYRFVGGQRRLDPVSAGGALFDVTDDRGELRIYGLPPGEYYVSSIASGPATMAATTANGASYVPTFYPGTATVDSAQRVMVEIGKEVGVAFPLVAARLARVSGIARHADGSPAARAFVSVQSRTGNSARGGSAQPDGTFTITAILPGDYFVDASLGNAQQPERENGRVPITVTGRDVSGVTVTITTGGTIRGRVMFDGQAPTDVRLTTLRPVISTTSISSIASPTTQEDGTFALNGVFEPGLVRVLSLPPGWFLKSVRLAGKDVTDTPVAVERGQELTGVEIVLTQKRAEISGSAKDDKGAVVSDYAVVVFPEDRSQWTAESRFIASGRPDQQGRFRIAGLPPGTYLATAIDYLETGSERDPELLERLRERATTVTLADGEAKSVTVSLQ